MSQRGACADGGGSGLARQYLAAGLIDKVDLHLVPVLLGARHGALERTRVIASPSVTHPRLRVVRDGE